MALNEQRAVANVRERKRTQKLNQAYKQLQSIIPKEPSDKMSKIHTLKLALAYIKFLNKILKESEYNPSILKQPYSSFPNDPCNSQYEYKAMLARLFKEYRSGRGIQTMNSYSSPRFY